MTGGWKVEENQKQVSLHFPPALEIAIAIPTFPPPRTRLYSWKGEPKTKGPTTLSSGSFFDENMLGFGFIAVEDGQELFVHYTGIRGVCYRSLSQGQLVEFVIIEGRKGPLADQVEVVGQKPQQPV
jgi:cold shock protein